MRRLTAFSVALALLLATAAVASAVSVDYVDRDASGNGSYEAMAVHPEAVYDATSKRTYIAYQGMGLDPYVAAYDHDTDAWIGPVRVGDNPLLQDFHGGPSIAIDGGGYIHIFYGAHFGGIKHAVSPAAGEIEGLWSDLGFVYADAPGWTDHTLVTGTYPQPLMVDGTLMLFYRVRDESKGVTDPTHDGAWAMVSSANPRETSSTNRWSVPELVIDVKSEITGFGGQTTDDSWYANFSVDSAGDVHVAFTWRAISSDDMFTRFNLYYMRRDHASQKWLVPSSEEATSGAARDRYAAALVWESDPEGVNEMVVRADDAGAPSILFLTGDSHSSTFDWKLLTGQRAGLGSQETAFSEPPDTITNTDDFFDAGDLELTADGPVAYLTVGGEPDPQSPPNATDAARGGDIVKWQRDSEGVWHGEDVMRSPGDSAIRYNNPQIVRIGNGAPASSPAKLMFSEWDNDGANFIHKVYLWGASGLLGRELTRDSERLSGANRVETAVAISKKAFPNGAQTYQYTETGESTRMAVAFVASKVDFPDVLCGAPLAHAYNAPLLLVSPDRLDDSVKTEIKRLFARTGSNEAKPKTYRVYILGSSAAVSSGVESSIRGLSGVEVVRIQGSDRYATSRAIALKLRTRLGSRRPRVIVASGEKFPDALVVSPLAARKGWPILLTRQASLPSATADAIASVGATESIVVGSEQAVSLRAYQSVWRATGSEPLRLGGATRYETGELIARYATGRLSGVESEKVLATDRLVVASGENFPDGLAGGVFAARFRAPMVVTTSQLNRSGIIPSPTESFVGAIRNDVLDVYVLGGEPAVSAPVYDRLMSLLPPPLEAD